MEFGRSVTHELLAKTNFTESFQLLKPNLSSCWNFTSFQLDFPSFCVSFSVSFFISLYLCLSDSFISFSICVSAAFVLSCVFPHRPLYGDVSVSSLHSGGEAFFSCLTGYRLQGPSVLICRNASTPYWSGNEPRCLGKVTITRRKHSSQSSSSLSTAHR